MKKILSILAVLTTLTACVHKMNIEQGNIITPELLAQIHTGMSEEQVKERLGTPMLINTFNDERIDYVYTNKIGHQKMSEQSISLIFKNHRLQKIESTF